ncbi:hypothetical protein J3R75_001575 [Oligosphaera ethanolica]|uniref:Uncharacterized protein n=1 Tax=Oligosphaera ethanolica TaxID=760260 RepID=A0AAE4AP08_9BACT|nr:hypothetical protein [Oligosphaera ethanolica]
MPQRAGTTAHRPPSSAYAIYTRQSRVRNDITLSSCDVQFQICRDHAEAVMPRVCTWCGRRDSAGGSASTPR